MEFGLEKYAVLTLEKGRYGNFPENMQLADRAILRHLEAGTGSLYVKYGNRSFPVQIRLLLLIASINMLANPVLLYCFEVLKCCKEELRELNIMNTGKTMHTNPIIHPSFMYLSSTESKREAS